MKRRFAWWFARLPLALAFLAGTALAQQAELDLLAQKAAEKISKSGKKRVVVLDWEEDPGVVTELGRSLSAKFAASLGQVGLGLQFLEREQIEASFEKKRMESGAVLAGRFAGEAGRSAGAELLISGEIREKEKSYELRVIVWNLSNDKKLAKLKTNIPKTPELENLQANQLGRRMPECKYCPSPAFPKDIDKESLKKGVVVVLRLVVTPQGQAKEIKVIKSAGKLDKRAVEAVKDWRFKPALYNGRPVYTVIMVEISFRDL
jgi:TonB family protein